MAWLVAQACVRLHRKRTVPSRAASGLFAAEIAAYARTPLLDSADPALVPLETLLGRDDARFRAGEEPPWRNRIGSRWER